MQPHIITHRGLEPSRNNFFPESSIEAFQDQLNRGFGLEFDPNFVKDGIVVSHDATLERITNGTDTRSFQEISENEATSFEYGKKKKGRMPTLEELLTAMNSAPAIVHALHFKGTFQTRKKNSTWLLNEIENFPTLWDHLVVFDVLPDTAVRFKKQNEHLHIAPSVAHPYDIKRYNKAVSGTLMTIEESISHRDIYDWVLLDEWDLSDENGKTKKLHTKENYEKLKKAGFNIALVTPELHGTSPGLLGGEAHPDAKNNERLFERIEEIIELEPDAIITDYPEEVRKLTEV
ncbi:MAG: hypothetical protein NUV98_02635 [Candidatus Roizmanbacteria bacterium]|nr:hypothetical protein [Candidatus Roizmanbacteria bacterium]